MSGKKMWWTEGRARTNTVKCRTAVVEEIWAVDLGPIGLGLADNGFYFGGSHGGF